MRDVFAAMSVAAVCLCAPAIATAQEAQPDTHADQTAPVPDPWEGFNRHMYAINDAADHAVLEPVARGYRAVTPQFVRTGVSNFLHNLSAPVTFVNDLLQGQIKRAGTTAARVGINSTLGLFGLLDPATDFGFERHVEDFGQTLAVWGVRSGPYVFVPLIGPTTVRDGAGEIVDLAFDPLNWARFHHDNETRGARAVVGGISTREELLDPVDEMRRTSIDPYSSVRATYQLSRESAIQNGLVDDEETPTLDDSPNAAPAEQAAPSTETPTPSEQSAPVTPTPGANTTKAQHQPVVKGGKKAPAARIVTSKPTSGDKP